MQTDVFPNRDVDYQAWLQNFSATAAANADQLGLSSEQVDTLVAANTAFQDAFEDHQAAKLAARSKRASKEESRLTSEEIARSVARFVSSNDTVSAGLKAQMGLRAAAVPTSVVTPPTELVASALAAGTNNLTWKRGENTRSASFIIECQTERGGPWAIIGVTHKLKFSHPHQVPGQPVFYRVSAFRNDIRSDPSNVAVVYEMALNRAA